MIEFKSPRIRYDEIKRKADEVRALFKEQSLPLDIHSAIEFDFGFEIRPVVNLRDKGNTEALLLRDRKAILIDAGYFQDDRQQNRVRFSLAHELGHIFIHEELGVQFDSIDEWVTFRREVDEGDYKWYERQADEFAGRLLVPPLELQSLITEAFSTPRFSRIDSSLFSSVEVKDVVAELLKDKFGVAQKTLAIRIDREQLWPPKI